MKKLLLVLFILVSVTSVFAADTKEAASTALKISGDFYVGGNMAKNDILEKDGKTGYSYFDYDLNLNAALVANENATVFLRLTYDKNVIGSGSVAKAEYADQEQTKSLLAVERAYLNYKFNTMFKLDTGLMGGGQWGTLFGNTEANIMRVKGTATVAEGIEIYAIYQKNTEVGADSTIATNPSKDGEKDDSNTYYLAGKVKAGPVTILPLFSYKTDGTNYSDATPSNETDLAQMGADIAVLGDFGMIGLESEFVYSKSTTKVKSPAIAPKDQKLMGAYVNLFAKLDPAKVGFVYAYASDKSDKGEGTYNWGKDFDVTVVMDDWTENTLEGWSVYKFYGEATFGAVTAGAAVAYGADNVKLGKATFTEIDVNAAYAIDAATEYSINAGYAMVKDTGFDANAYVIYHGMKIKF